MYIIDIYNIYHIISSMHHVCRHFATPYPWVLQQAVSAQRFPFVNRAWHNFHPNMSGHALGNSAASCSWLLSTEYMPSCTEQVQNKPAMFRIGTLARALGNRRLNLRGALADPMVHCGSWSNLTISPRELDVFAERSWSFPWNIGSDHLELSRSHAKSTIWFLYRESMTWEIPWPWSDLSRAWMSTGVHSATPM